jgi:Holliday junction DNA helicase RuvB
MKDGDIELLAEISKFENSVNMEKEFKIGWSWRHVRIWPATLSRLFKDGYLENVFRSNSYTGYRLSELGKKLVTGTESEETGLANDEPIPADNLFADIVGHDEVKELLLACLLAERPVHVLLAGPPALAKSLFLWDIEQAAGERALWLVGSATSKAGLWDVVAKRRPQMLLVDELDKMNAADTAALLSLMEGGRLVRAKKGRELDLCNQLGVLVRRERLDRELADEVARRLDGISQDVRDAIRVARLVPQKGVERAIKLLSIGGDSNEK